MKAYISLLVFLCGLTTALVNNHIYVKIPKNWTDAQSYCRQNYKDLSTIQSEEEQAMLIQIAGGSLNYTWIGLYRDMTNTQNWLWSDGDSFSYTQWRADQPNNLGGIQNCVMTENCWCDFDCPRLLPFFCSSKRFILVKESKTWEEALEYCRAHHTDLASVNSDGQLQLTNKEAMESHTASVWTGLRFLAGEWLWANNEPLQNQVSQPHCPVYRCGARNRKNYTWEYRDCDEKLNFLCN